MLAEVINLPRNVDVRCPLLELSGRHVIVLQVKVPQIAPVKQLVDKVAESFTLHFFCPKWKTSSDRSREFPDTSCSSVTVEPCHTRGPFSSAHWCRVSVISRWFQRQRYDPDAQEVDHLRQPADLVYELDMQP